MSQTKKLKNKENACLPFPYPMLHSEQRSTIWPFKEEGFVLINSILNHSDKLVLVTETAAAFALIKMGFFGLNSNKEINNFYLNHKERFNKEVSPFSLGYYSLNVVDIPMALTKFEHDINNSNQVKDIF